MLEGLSRRLLDATEGVARDLVAATDLAKVQHRRWFHFPAIVTNARLVTCRHRPDEIDLSTGFAHLPVDRFEEVGWLRFHKTLSVPSPEEIARSSSIRSAQQEAERTVFVVNAASLVSFLSTFFPVG